MRDRLTAGTMRSGYLFLLAALCNLPPVIASVPRWSVQEVTFEARNTYTDPYAVDVRAEFIGPGTKKFTVRGFWDGGRTWRIRWTPTEAGKWTWTTRSPDPSMDGRTGSLECSSDSRYESEKTHGFLRRDSDHPYSFVFDDGTHYFLFGNTAYAIVANAMSGGGWKQYVDKTRAHGMNKMRFYVNRATDPSRAELTASAGNPERPDLIVWNKVDEVVRYMGEREMTADLILFQRAQVNALDEAAARRYLDYVVARYAAFPHVMWCLQNEWEYTNKPHSFWTALGKHVSAIDPWARRDSYVRALSVHQHTRYDWQYFGEDWYSHVIVQLGVRNRGKAHRGGDEWNLPQDRRGVFANGDDWGSFSIVYNHGRNVPVVNDEYGYIGEPQDETGRGPDGKPVRFSREKHRRTMWSIYASGGYGSAGDKNQYSDGRPYVSANWHDEPEFGDVRNLIGFFKDKGFAYWKMKPQQDIVRGERVYVLADSGRDYIAYAAAGGQFSLSLPEGDFEARRFDPRTSADSAIRTVSGGTAASFQLPDAADWVVYLRKKQGRR